MEIPNEKRQDDLRQQIMAIQLDKTLSQQEKAIKMQQLMMPTQITPKKKIKHKLMYKNEYGCQHYTRNCLLLAECCKEYVVCRLCHDEENDHEMDRFIVKMVKCMHCDVEQPFSDKCNTCEMVFGHYKCDICHMLENRDLDIFHCDACGICRRGKSEDFYHCDTCNTCMIKDAQYKHTCLESTMHSDCPICNEFLFSSLKPACLLQCGHSIHNECLEHYLHNNYQCPLCLKSLADMTEFFERMSVMVNEHQMPDEYKHYKADVLCNDCHSKNIMKYHFVGHLCGNCNSWNTRVMTTWKDEDEETSDTNDYEADEDEENEEINEERQGQIIITSGDEFETESDSE
eukprot:NODE_89_length_21781_cov_0.895836.p5 type:complete len:344 gc:universal NODE_89_length_21781_cov_0.895836:12216-13247(+)